MVELGLELVGIPDGVTPRDTLRSQRSSGLNPEADRLFQYSGFGLSGRGNHAAVEDSLLRTQRSHPDTRTQIGSVSRSVIGRRIKSGHISRR